MRLLNVRTILTTSAAAAALAGTLAMSAGPAEALPAGVQPLPLASAGQPEVTLVSGGCGFYRHRGPFGGCRPNFVGPVYGYRYGGPFGYGYGWHRGFGWHRWHRW